MTWGLFITGTVLVALVAVIVHHQRRLRLRAHLMKEAIRNQDFSFRLPTNNLLPGERAMQEALNELGEIIRQQINQNEVESWERLTRVLTHEMMNATAPITSISQSLMNRSDVKNTPLEDGIRAIFETSQHMSNFVVNYRKMSELEKPKMSNVDLRTTIDDISKIYPQLEWKVNISQNLTVRADTGMLRQVLMNLIKNAVEANAKTLFIDVIKYSQHNKLVSLFIGNDGLPIPAENRQSLFVPFFTTKRSGSGIGLSLSRRMMIQQGGMLDLAETSHHRLVSTGKTEAKCNVAFILSLQTL
jgi:Signal transduction histidine kinase involved in nitrogen fixation and metabolism regulation